MWKKIMRKKFTSLWAALLTLCVLLSACGGDLNAAAGNNAQTLEPFTLTMRVRASQETLDPPYDTTAGGETILYHLYENLLRWAADADGQVTLAPGQATSWVEESDSVGHVTYTFSLRSDILWSDGERVTAEDFVTAWQRLADPGTVSPYHTLLSVVSGYDKVQETGDPSLLAVSAPNDGTFVVKLEGSCAYFLTELCAGLRTMPTRANACNGPYTLSQRTEEEVVLCRSETYYDHLLCIPDELRFVTIADDSEAYQQFLDGKLDLVDGLPADVPDALSDPVTDMYAVLFNTQHPPFDDANIRLAFRLAVDTQAAADSSGVPAAQPAVGIVPYGVPDYGQSEAEERTGDTEEPDGKKLWDFRAHSLEKVTVPVEDDYAADCARARQLLSAAGYPNGEGLPALEYIYVESPQERAIAEALQKMWREQLGANVIVRGVTQEMYEEAITPPDPEEETAEGAGTGEEDSASEALASAVFTMAARFLPVPYGDAEALLHLWHTGDSGNVTGYSSENFDILLDTARTALPEARDGFLHDAEAILLVDAPVIPVLYPSTVYLFSESLAGLASAPNGVYFLSAVRRKT